MCPSVSGSATIDKVVENTTKYMFATWRKQKGWSPLHIVDAQGCYYFDTKGKRYLDFSSQLMCSNLGHKNRAVIDSVKRQIEELAFMSPYNATCEVKAELSQLLSELLPTGAGKYFFTTSGTEANEAAIRIARLYTGRYKLISRYQSYHGSTAGSIALTGDYRRWFCEPANKLEGIVFAPQPYCYRCPLGQTYPDCGIACADYVEHMIENEGNVGGIVIEPISGSNGVVVPPEGYLERLAQIARDHDILLIADEVMTGWGRVGEWFAVDHWNIKPDILTTAKGITGAYLPLGLTATSRKIADHFENNYLPLGHTYEGHPTCLAAAKAAILEYKRLNLIENSRKMGRYLGKRLNELKVKHPCVGDVRGMGLFWAVDLSKNQATRKPFNTYEDKFLGRNILVEEVARQALAHGVYVFGTISHLIIAPPLIVTERELDEGVDAIDQALFVADKEVDQ